MIMTIEKVGIDDARALELVPLWLQQEAAYANAKFRQIGRVCTQQEVFNGGLEPGRSGYQDFYNYGRFKNFLVPELHGRKTVLRGSSQLGKFVGVSRALVSVVFMQEKGLPTLDDADTITFKRLEDRLLPINEITYDLYDVDLDGFFRESVEQPLVEIASAAAEQDVPAVTKLAEAMFDDHVHLFAAYTKHHGVIAQPGLSSTQEATDWAV